MRRNSGRSLSLFAYNVQPMCERVFGCPMYRGCTSSTGHPGLRPFDACLLSLSLSHFLSTSFQIKATGIQKHLKKKEALAYLELLSFV